ncbi:hypothetical protein HHK36_003159 [Tetracentron sinense]|uniref:Pentatricopeptide repeat-containing protein n=1 Tax=Tetracentron sinense TaxID=13715 RepID=A0A835DS71_TETSI|nr:hypothetical protein HHK36_003159 [Tetracentron sinense]
MTSPSYVAHCDNPRLLYFSGMPRENPNPYSYTHILKRVGGIGNLRLSLMISTLRATFVEILSPDECDALVVLNGRLICESLMSKWHGRQGMAKATWCLWIHVMEAILAKSEYLANIKSILLEGIASEVSLPASVALMNRVKIYLKNKEKDCLLEAIEDVGCGSMKHPCHDSYNILMNLYAEKGKNSEAVQMFSRMIDEGANPNSRTYTVMIEHLTSSGNLDSAMEVFKRLPLMRIKHTSRQYSVLAQGFTKMKRFDVVKKLVEEMRSDGLLPGRAMRFSLKCMREAGFVEETEEFVREFSPNDRIGNVAEFCIDSSDDEDNDNGEFDGDGIHLKPWLDPSALASALSDWSPNEVLALEDAKFVWTTRLVCKMLRSFRTARTAWLFFCWVAYQPGGFTHDAYTVSRMIVILARDGHVELVDQLVSKMKREGIRLSFSTMRLIIDFYGFSEKTDAAMKTFRDIEQICGPVSKFNLMVLYSSLLRTLAKCRRGLDAMDLLEEMILSGIVPDIQTFSGLMQHFALEGDMRTVQKLFGMVRQSGVEPDAYMFQILIRAYCKRERAALALRVFEDMKNSNLMPDAATKALLVKSLWKEGKLRQAAAAVEEKSEEINGGLPLALPGHVWTVSSADLTSIYHIYSGNFATNCA